jgi:hypothetical protein
MDMLISVVATVIAYALGVSCLFVGRWIMDRWSNAEGRILSILLGTAWIVSDVIGILVLILGVIWTGLLLATLAMG